MYIKAAGDEVLQLEKTPLFLEKSWRSRLDPWLEAQELMI